MDDVEPRVEEFAALETEEQVDDPCEGETAAPGEPETSSDPSEDAAAAVDQDENVSTPSDDTEQLHADTAADNETAQEVQTEEHALADDSVDIEDGEDELLSADTVAHHDSEAEPVQDDLSPADDVEAALSEQQNEAVTPETTGTPDSEQPGMSMFSFALFSRILPLHRAESCMCQRSGVVGAASRITRLVDLLILIGYPCLPAHHSPPIPSSHHRISMSWPRAAMHARNLHKSRRVWLYSALADADIFRFPVSPCLPCTSAFHSIPQRTLPPRSHAMMYQEFTDSM